MASEVKVTILTELGQASVHIASVQRSIRVATPMANGLTVMKSLEKLLRAIEKVKTEVQELTI